MLVTGIARKGPILEEVTEGDDMEKKPIPDFLTSVRVVTKHLAFMTFSILPSTSIHHEGTLGPQQVSLVHPLLSIFPDPSIQTPPRTLLSP